VGRPDPALQRTAHKGRAAAELSSLAFFSALPLEMKEIKSK